MISEVLLKVAGMEQDFWDETYRPRPSAAGQCIRALVYRRMGLAPEPWPDRFPVVLDDGTWHEELTVEWLSKSAYEIHDRQMEITIGEVAGQTVKGHIDGIIEDVRGEQWLFEHKAINHFSWARYEALTEAGREFPSDEGYAIQIQLYLHSRELREMGINRAILLIKNKNTGQYCEFEIFYNAQIAEAALAKLRQVEAAAESGEIPERPHNRDVDWQCSYCRYERRCWEGYEGERSGPIETADAELAAAAQDYAEANRTASAAGKEKDAAKKRIVHRLDELKLREAKVGGFSVTWLQRHRKGYEVKPGTFYELRVTEPKDEGRAK